MYNVSLRYVFNNRIQQEVENDEQLVAFEDETNYLSLDASIAKYTRLSDSWTLETSGYGRIATGNTILDSYRVGGPRQTKAYTYGFSGINDAGLLVGNHIYGKAAIRWQFMPSLYLSPNVQYLIGERYNLDSIENIQTYGVGLDLGYNSPIGPVSLSLGYADSFDRLEVNFGLGYRHIL